jgi:hypothetical protein
LEPSRKNIVSEVRRGEIQTAVEEAEAAVERAREASNEVTEAARLLLEGDVDAIVAEFRAEAERVESTQRKMLPKSDPEPRNALEEIKEAMAKRRIWIAPDDDDDDDKGKTAKRHQSTAPDDGGGGDKEAGDDETGDDETGEESESSSW